ncbi:MAG: ABC transporter permease [Pseudonocardiales bacterium]|nr:ABC transporter permease [Pseudonocardiales bacterium]
MSTVSYAVSDAATMLRRDFRHLQRYPVMTINTVGLPTFMLLLFVYVFGGAMSAALGAAGGGTSYINYLVPGLLLMAVGSGCASTAVGVNSDMTEGIIARFRTMAISRASVLTGHVVGSVIRTMVSIFIVLGVALLIGFRPTAGPVEWLASIGVLAIYVLAFTWLAVALGMVAKSPEGANGSTLLFQFGPFFSSAFVSPESMPAGMRWFAEHMPFTPMIDTLRGLLLGTPIGNSAVIAAAWCVVIAVGGYLWARAAYNRDPARLGL